MLRFLADENSHGRIVRGLLRRQPALDIVRVQDVPGMVGAGDPEVLALAAAEDRITLTHDVATMPHFANARVADGLPMPGVFALIRGLPIGPLLDELALIAEFSTPEEWRDRVWYYPLA
jgi:hypothetical protein